MTYLGSHVFQFAADAAGLPIDQLNFLLAQIVAILSGFAFRHYLKPCPQNTLKRHLVAILWGIVLGLFCFGGQMWHLFCQSFVAYLAILFIPRKYVHMFVGVFAMSYLSGLHIYRLFYDYGNYTLDITCPMMIITQKLTAFAFAYYDGGQKEEDLNKDQKQQQIKDSPHLIEFLSYVFNFQGIIVGPLCFYQDYIDFITGNNILNKQKVTSGKVDESTPKIVQPSIWKPVITKILTVILLGIIFFKVTMVFRLEYLITPEVTSRSMWYQFFLFQLSASSQRVKYYMAWVLGDLVNNASGLGFNGYREDNPEEARWDLVTNVDIIGLETSTSIKVIFDRWNIQTQLWLRRIAYDRLRTGKTLGVFVLSAFWHGFYPGYYLTFVLCAFMVYSGRGIRRKIRPLFMGNKATQILYSVITWAGTITAVNYSAVSFDYLDTKRSIEFYNQWYWIPHIFVLIVSVTLPGGSTKPPRKTAAPPKVEEPTPFVQAEIEKKD